MQEIYKILQEELQKKFGTAENVDQVLEKLGEAVLTESAVKILESVEEVNRAELVEHLNNGDMDKFLQLAIDMKVDVESIYEEASKSIVAEAFADIV
jgi:hypothetical protein